MPIESEIIVVSGLPRSGTSLMMQMLHQGGCSILTDSRREPDTDNPAGYFEYENVKRLRQDTSWLPQARGKAVKIVSQLLYDLPATEHYRVIFMERDADEVLVSQEKMLRRLNQPAVPRETMKQACDLHLQRLFEWLAQRSEFTILRVSYNYLIQTAAAEISRISEFLDGSVDVGGMSGAIDPALYRNRSPGQPD